MIFPFGYCQRGNLENEINFTKSQILVKALICIYLISMMPKHFLGQFKKRKKYLEINFTSQPIPALNTNDPTPISMTPKPSSSVLANLLGNT